MIEINGLQGVPMIENTCNIGEIFVETIKKQKFEIYDGDVICVASKICSIAEGNIVKLDEITPSIVAKKIHEKIPRKDSRLIQVIINQTQSPDGRCLEVEDNYIGAWLPNGLYLTSAGVDKGKDGYAIVLPNDCDKTAKNISDTFYLQLGVRVSVIITDSDGRIDKKGANQVAVGLYGINGLRIDKENKTVETLCDLLASAAGLVMGQRGTNIPLVAIHGLKYEKSSDSSIKDALN
ncbi:coenzyme F420-0:L-glutamate ligase [Lactobacillus sp. ESL0731]|uniref:coenzyme F420-0:L-glutamate ligase n=1 Tax=unclassified Lactobacillus TaxID=2620435 RepID=UPI0023F750B6|nr:MULTISPECIES: coenzyme F420-0:L-glutamate ligase [unclassified Lactobacillus]WEV50414.1 coenzyme F420-0:L-glutamate ligase [Lactobacillus sp. ESL0700]WEV61544.1 coenzyme F420-0:L-glutamate ligase [Lactobacillus sp. ESL0731]